MFALDLFNNDHERRLAEGAVDQLEQRRIDDLAMKMDDLVARAKTATTPEAKAALVREFQKCKDERDGYFKIKDECMGYGGLGETATQQDLDDIEVQDREHEIDPPEFDSDIEEDTTDLSQAMGDIVKDFANKWIKRFPGNPVDTAEQNYDAYEKYADIFVRNLLQKHGVEITPKAMEKARSDFDYYMKQEFELHEAGIGQDIANKTEKMARATPSTPSGKVASTVKNAAKWLAGKGGPGREGPTYEGKDDAWQEETPWTDIPKAKSGKPVDPRGEVTHLSDVARRKAERDANMRLQIKREIAADRIENKIRSAIAQKKNPKEVNEAKQHTTKHLANARINLTESRTYKLWESAGQKIVEYKLTPDQIQQLFQQVEQGATAAGGNRTVVGQGKDVASAAGQAVSQAWGELKDKIYNSKPMAGFAAEYDKAAEALKQATGGDAGVMKYIQKYRDFAKKHPYIQTAVYAALVAAAGISTAGVGGAAALTLLKTADLALQGKDIRSAAWGGIKAGATALAASELMKYLTHPSTPLPPKTEVQMPDGTMYVVQPGDTVSEIAQKTGNSVDAIVKANQGQSINVSGPTADPAFTQVDAMGNQTGMAADPDKFIKMPRLGNPDDIKAGQNLFVPTSAGPTPTYQGGVGTAADSFAKMQSGVYDPSQITANQAAKWGVPGAGATPADAASAATNAASGATNGGYNAVQNAATNALSSTQPNPQWDNEIGQRVAGAGKLAGAQSPNGQFPTGLNPRAKIGMRESYVDRDLTVYTWALNESIGLPRGGVQLTNEGIGSMFKSAASKAGQWAQTKGHNLTTKVTADKLQSAWKNAGSPTDSDTIAQVLQSNGVSPEIVNQIFTSMKIPLPAKAGAQQPQTAKKHTGGRVAGQLSQTPNAIRQRQARAGQQPTAGAQPTAVAQPAAGGAGAFGQMAKDLSTTGTSSTGGMTQATSTGLRHTANPNNPNMAPVATATAQEPVATATTPAAKPNYGAQTGAGAKVAYNQPTNVQYPKVNAPQPAAGPTTSKPTAATPATTAPGQPITVGGQKIKPSDPLYNKLANAPIKQPAAVAETGGGLGLDPKTRLELKNRKGRQKIIARHAGKPSDSWVDEPTDPAQDRLLTRARREHPKARSDAEALAMRILDKETDDVTRLDRVNDREDRMIDKLSALEKSLQQQIDNLKSAQDLDEGRMGEIDAMRQDLERMNERQFYTAYGISKAAFQQKYRTLLKPALDEGQQLHQGDPIVVTAPNEFEGATGEIAEFSPSGKFVVVNLYNHGRHSMHLSDVEYNQYADDQAEEDDWYDDQEDTLEESNVNPQFINVQATKMLVTAGRKFDNRPVAEILAPLMKEYNLTLQQVDQMVPGGIKKLASGYGIFKEGSWGGSGPAGLLTPYAVYTKQNGQVKRIKTTNKIGKPMNTREAEAYVAAMRKKDPAKWTHDTVWAGPADHDLSEEFKGNVNDTELKNVDPANHSRGEGDFVKNQLHSMKRVITHLDNAIGGGEDIPDWVQSEIAQAADKIIGVMNYSISSKEQDIEKHHGGNALMKEVKADPAGSWVVYGGSKVVKFKTHGGAKAYAEKSGGKVASSEFYADKIQKQGVEEGKWDYPKSMTTIPKFDKDADDYLALHQGAKFARKNKADRKEFRKTQKAQAHKELMTGKKEQGVAEGNWSNVIHTTDRSDEKAQREQEHKKQAGLAATVLKNHSQALDPKEINLLTRYNLHHRGKPGVRFDRLDNEKAQQLIQNVLRFNQQGVAEGGRSMDRATVIQKLEDMYTKLYQREDPESYDLPAAVMYWSKLPLGELAMEFHHAEDQLKQSRGIKEAETDYSKRRARERDVDAGRPVKPLPKNPQTDYARKRAKEKRDMERFGESTEDSSTSSEAVERAVLNRIMVAHTDLLKQFGPEKVMQAAEEVAYNVGDVDEIGTSDVSAYVNQVRQILGA